MKKSNIIKMFSILTMAAAGAFAVGAGLSSKKAESVEAAAPGSDVTTYIYTYSDSIQNWEADGCSTKVWDSTNSQWLTLTNISSNTYSFSWPATCASVIIARHDGTDWKGQSWDIGYNLSYNYYEITSWSDGKASYNCGYVNNYSAGSKLYVDVQDNMSWWFEDGYSTYVYGALGSSTFWLSPTRVGESNLSVFTFNEAKAATFLIVVRNKNASWSGKTNQTPNIGFSSSNLSSNAIKLGADTSGTTAVKGMEAFSDDFLVDSFAYYFLSATSEYCSEEITSTSTIAGVLTSLAAEGTAVKNTFAASTISHSSSGHTNNANEALSRYWNMTHETDHGKGAVYSDFLGLGDTFMARASSNINYVEKESKVPTLVIVLVSITALSAIGGFFFIRKRKEN